jgi:hypothetical protein
MANVGAPKGNGNASRQPWKDALRYALANYVKGDVKRGGALKAIGAKLVHMAVEGDLAAIKEVGDRLEGKAHQSIGGQEGGAPIAIVHTVNFVSPK